MQAPITAKKRCNQPPVLAIVIPCYYEEEALPTTAEVLRKLVEDMIQSQIVEKSSYICFVNDGSQDRTWEVISGLMEQSDVYRGINLSRNFGHQAAVLAGLFTARADAYVSIDADLQDDPQKIKEMVELYLEGYDIVYGCRGDRSTDSWFKRTSAELFYKIRAQLGCNTIPNHADYRLMSARSVAELKKYSEVNLYLRGIVTTLGFPSAKVFYKRAERTQGTSKYPLMKMLKFAWDGVANFSEAPLHLCLWLGVIGFLTSMLLIIYSLFRWIEGATLPGWTSTVILVSTLSSMQFIFMGVMGLYIGKIFKETKRRPHFIIQDDCSCPQTDNGK